MITTAAILARGLGSRMRQSDADAAPLDEAQSRAAERGLKGMIPIDRPFLDYVLSALADAGITDVVLVIAPDHDVVRDYFTHVSPPQRVRIRFAEQREPSGTAHAVLAAAETIGDVPFLVLNADNYYPVEAFRALRELGAETANARDAAVVAFHRDALMRDGSIDAKRIGQFASLVVRDDNTLSAIVEKPGIDAPTTSPWVGMNLWLVNDAIVDACRRVSPSSRGEYELPQAVALAMADGHTVRVARVEAAVLDLSHQRDIAKVTDRLRGLVVHP